MFMYMSIYMYMYMLTLLHIEYAIVSQLSCLGYLEYSTVGL